MPKNAIRVGPPLANLAEDISHADPSVRPLLFVLDALSPGMWTVSSCGGHRDTTWVRAGKWHHVRMPLHSWRAFVVYEGGHADAGRIVRWLDAGTAWERRLFWLMRRNPPSRVMPTGAYELVGGPALGLPAAVNVARRLRAKLPSKALKRLQDLKALAAKYQAARRARLRGALTRLKLRRQARRRQRGT